MATEALLTYVSTVNTICERIHHVLELKQISKSRAERAARFRRGELSTFLRRETRSMRHDRAQRLAKALGVRHEWLSDGTGPMSDDGQVPLVPPPMTNAPPPPPDAVARAVERDPYTTRAPVTAMLKAAKADPALIAALRAEQHDSGDPGANDDMYWWNRVTHYKEQVDRVRTMLKLDL